MVEKSVKEIKKETNPKHTVQEMLFKHCDTTNNIIGVLIKCKEETVVVPHTQLFDQEQLATRCSFIEFKEHTYLKSMTTWQKEDSVKKIAFQFCDIRTHAPLDVQFAGQCEEDSEIKQFDSDNAHFLNIFNVSLTSYLKTMTASQSLLPAFNPGTLVKTVIDQNENYIINYSDMKKLEGMIPPDSQVNDGVFRKLYNNLRAAISQISTVKAVISDAFQDNIYFIQSLDQVFTEIAAAIGPSLRKGKGRFKPEEFPREKQKLQDLLNQLSDCLKKIKDLEPKVSQLRFLREDIENLKRQLFSDQQVKHTLRLYSNPENLQAMAQCALNTERRLLEEVKTELFRIDETLPKLSGWILLYEQLVKEKKESREEVSQQSLGVNKQSMDSKFKDLLQAGKLSGAEKLDELEDEFEKTISQLQEEYNRKKQKLEERIENERDKMSSDVTVQTGAGSKTKSNHFILILDESGSMHGSWSQLREVFNKFVGAFKNDETPHIFSVVLFDHGGRILFKRCKANDVGDLGELQGGGTTYEQGLALAQQLVNITPQGQSPVMLFMTDGGTDQDDINNSQRILKQIYSHQSYKDGMLFAIGFGTGYNRSALQQLSEAANGGKTSVTIGSTEYELVLEAIDETELLNIFLGISSTFEKSAQEAAVDALERQRKIDEKMFDQQLQFYREQHKKRIEDLQQRAAFRNTMKNIAENGKAEELTALIMQQESQLDKDIQDLSTKLENFIQEKSKNLARKDILDKKIVEQINNVEQTEERLKKNTEIQKTSEEDKVKYIGDLVDKSKLQDLEGVRTLFSQLGSVNGTIENLVQSVRHSKNLLAILKGKIDDMMFQFDGELEKNYKRV